MFKDTKEELQRLEAQLMEEEPRPIQPEPDETAAGIDAFLSEDRPADHPGAYANFANGYGCRAYNTDRTELEPEELSQQLLEPEATETHTGLWITILLLLLGILGVICFWLLRIWGIIG